jgi:hypothetical protein
MRVNDGFDDGKSQSGAIAFALTRRVYAVETIEQSGEMLSRDFRARVLDANDGSIFVPCQRNQQGLPMWSMPNGVRYEVAERPP